MKLYSYLILLVTLRFDILNASVQHIWGVSNFLKKFFEGRNREAGGLSVFLISPRKETIVLKRLELSAKIELIYRS